VKASITIDGVEILVPELQYLHTKAGRQLARIVLKAGLNVVGKQMKKDIDPRVKESAKAVGNRVTIYRQNVTRAKVGFNVGKDARKVPFRRERTSKGGVGIGPTNVHWFISGTTKRYRYGDQGKTIDTGKALSLRQRKARAMARGNGVSTGQMPALQEGLAAMAAQKSIPEMKTVMARAGRRYLEARAKKIANKAAKARAAAASRRLLTATGKG